MNTVCACLILIPTIALSVSIDQQFTNSSDPGTLNFFHVTSDGEILVKTELDILMSLDEYKELQQPEGNSRKKRKAAARYTKWFNREVNYAIVGKMEKNRKTILQAINHWEKYTCLTFKENPSASVRIDFQYGNTCTSRIGAQLFSNGQPLYLTEFCAWFDSTIIHEIGHAIGFQHEHNRPDRDRYITIHWDNIHSYYHDSYRIRAINTYNIPYDYTSVMHYATDGIKMSAKDPYYTHRTGYAPGLSFKDIKLANLMYDCISPYCPNKECPFNGFPLMKSLNGQPKCECWCDSGNVNIPLVLCSSIDKEAPGPNLPAASSLPATNVSRCVDMLQNCIYLKEEGFCRTEMIAMYKVCTKTCEFCRKGSELCMDLEDGYGMMAASGVCQQEGLREIMSQLCPKSCGLCAAISAPCDIEFSLMEPSNPIDRGVSNRMRWITVVSLIFVASGFCM